jgi:hypothetical protein
VRFQSIDGLAIAQTKQPVVHARTIGRRGKAGLTAGARC